MYLNTAAMNVLRANMPGKHYEHEVVGGDILASVRQENGDTLAFHQLSGKEHCWSISMTLDAGTRKEYGIVQLPSYYTARQYAAYFDNVCEAVHLGEIEKAKLMIQPPEVGEDYSSDLRRLAAMCFIPGYEVRYVEEGHAEDAPGIWFRHQKHSDQFSIVPDSPEVGLCHFAIWDRGKHEIGYNMFEWSYDTEDIVAFRHTAYALLAQYDNLLSERLNQ